MARLDLVIRGGEIVNAGDVARADVGIAGGVVAQIGGELAGEREIDATGKLLLPGGIDAHVHLSNAPGPPRSPRWVDDFTSGSAAALAGGITTIGNMTFLGPGETPLAGLAREAAVARAQAMADVLLHPVLGEVTPEVLAEVPRLLDAGCNSIKAFMSTPRFDPQVRGYVEATRRAGEAGLLTLLHCEDAALLADATAQLLAAGRSGLRHYAESRPVIAEVVATQRAVVLAAGRGHRRPDLPRAPLLGAVARGLHRGPGARRAGLCRDAPVLSAADAGVLRRTRRSQVRRPAAALGAGGRRRALGGTPAGDDPHGLHRPCPVVARGQTSPRPVHHQVPAGRRESADNAPDALLQGGPGRAHLAQPARGGPLDQRRHAVQATRTIAVGSDADIVVLDPRLTRTIERARLKSNADYSVYGGCEVTGWPVLTLRPGAVVFRDDEVVGQPRTGTLLLRGPHPVLRRWLGHLTRAHHAREATEPLATDEGAVESLDPRQSS